MLPTASADKYGTTAAMLAAQQGMEMMDLVRWFAGIRLGESLLVKDRRGRDAVYYAFKCGAMEVVTFLVEEVGIDVNSSYPATRGARHSLLHLCAFQGYQAITQYLLEKGANPCAMDSLGRMPHHIASVCGHLDVLQALLCGPWAPPLDVKDIDGLGAFQFAAINGHLPIVKWLAERREIGSTEVALALYDAHGGDRPLDAEMIVFLVSKRRFLQIKERRDRKSGRQVSIGRMAVWCMAFRFPFAIRYLS